MKESEIDSFLDTYIPDIQLPNSLCFKCKFYEFRGKCSAFPDDIPDEVFSGDFQHTKPYPTQDNDIVFKPI
jgi:hypothetical protein